MIVDLVVLLAILLGPGAVAMPLATLLARPPHPLHRVGRHHAGTAMSPLWWARPPTDFLAHVLTDGDQHGSVVVACTRGAR